MAWTITLNKDHVRKWQRWGMAWLVYVAFGLIAGWGLKPRMDEFLFVLIVPPLAILIPYLVFCLIGAALRSLWPIRTKGRRWMFRRIEPRNRLGE